MFLSLSTGSWLLIAAAATAVNVVAMQWIIQIPQYQRLQYWGPALAAFLAGSHALTAHDPLAETLYAYSALLLVLPVALGPVRGRITSDYYRWLKDPATRTGTATMVWVLGSMAVMLGATVVGWTVGRHHGAA